jgi:predicted dehydrogenase
VSDQVHVGFIGAGHIVNQRYLPGYQQVAEQAVVVAIADPVSDREARFAETWGVSNAFTDYREMLAMPGLDAVHVCTPPFTHATTAIAALQSGKHVYVEKPPAMTAGEVRAMAKAGRQAGKLLMMGSNMVYYHETQTLRHMIEEGALGDLYYGKVEWLGRGGSPRGWFRERAKAGGGALMDGGSHSIDIFLYLTGVPRPISVVGRTFDKFTTFVPPLGKGYRAMDIQEGAADVPVSDVEELATGFIQFEGGLALSMHNSWKVHLGVPNGLYVAGTKAGARWMPLEIYHDVDDLPTSTTPALEPEEKTHVQAIRHFVDCIQQGKETQSPGERSIVTMEIIEALYRSAASGGREVRLG